MKRLASCGTAVIVDHYCPIKHLRVPGKQTRDEEVEGETWNCLKLFYA
jgi:hypothetical protein